MRCTWEHPWFEKGGDVLHERLRSTHHTNLRQEIPRMFQRYLETSRRRADFAEPSNTGPYKAHCTALVATAPQTVIVCFSRGVPRQLDAGTHWNPLCRLAYLQHPLDSAFEHAV